MKIIRAILAALVPPLVLLFCWYNPISNRLTRCTILIFGLLLLAEILIFVWKTKPLRILVLSLYALIAGFLLFPISLPRDPAPLREKYTKSLRSYEGRYYIWGGEGFLGIDCSGLIRRSMEDALFQRGIATFNPAFFRESIWLWWNDTTAEQIGKGYAGRTVPVTTCFSLQTLDHSQLQPGDLAVTSSGTHVMAYLGDETWIAADPTEGCVKKFNLRQTRNSYFFTPMNIVRWKSLARQQ